MILLVVGVPLLVALFGYLCRTNPYDPTWIDSLLRTSAIWGGMVVMVIGMAIEAKYLDKKIIKGFCNFMEGKEK